MFKNQIKNINSSEKFSAVQCGFFHAYVNDTELNEFIYLSIAGEGISQLCNQKPMIFPMITSPILPLRSRVPF